MKAPFTRTPVILTLLFGALQAQESEPLQAPMMPPTVMSEASEAAKSPELDFVIRSNSILEKIRENERQIDPFGLPMDPTNAVDTLAMSEEFEDEKQATSLNASAFKTALQDLPISGIYPKRQTIVIGARSFNRGEQFGLKLEELTIRLRVEGIKGTSIYFRDMDTQEVASVDFNPRPAEFEPITRNSEPKRGKGITPMNELFIVN